MRRRRGEGEGGETWRRLVCYLSADLAPVFIFIFPTYLRRLHVQYFRDPSLRKGSVHQSKDEMHTRKTLSNTMSTIHTNTCTDQIY